jgi:preprotein translocase subunit SecY
MPDLRKKILYTIGLLLIYRMLCFIPTPGVNHDVIRQALQDYSLLGFINSMTGSDMGNYSIMAMGITPYINASIIMQLLTVAIPKLEEMNKDQDGRKKIAQITRYVTVALGFLQAVALTTGLQAASGFLNVLTIGFCLATGTCLAMWLGERITEKGIGNGISLLIFAGIISRFAGSVVTAIGNMFKQGFGTTGMTNGVVFIVSIAMIVAVVFIDLGERRVPVQYAKRMVGRKMYGGQSTHIPLKVDASGVLPLIFASAIMQFPSTILAFFPSSSAYTWWNQNVTYGSWVYQLIFAVMIFGFTFFYSTISFNPVDISKNIQQNGGMIPGIRQGRPTSDFLSRTVRRITLFGAIYLALLATIPTIFYHLVGASLPFAASSLLIAVSVSLETTRQLESHMTMRNYKGFLK